MEKNDLKFRVWNGSEMEHNIMVGKFGIFYVNPSNNGIDENDTASLSPFNTKYPDDIPLMRFTGLYDKNNKEIFEDDIVTAWSEGVKGTFKIKWRQEGSPCWILYPAWQGGKMWHIAATEHKKGKQFISVIGEISTTEKVGFYDDGLEIIGNVYENPEIINGFEKTEAGGKN